MTKYNERLIILLLQSADAKCFKLDVKLRPFEFFR
jgi:hypothetical protein